MQAPAATGNGHYVLGHRFHGIANRVPTHPSLRREGLGEVDGVLLPDPPMSGDGSIQLRRIPFRHVPLLVSTVAHRGVALFVEKP